MSEYWKSPSVWLGMAMLLVLIGSAVVGLMILAGRSLRKPKRILRCQSCLMEYGIFDPSIEQPDTCEGCDKRPRGRADELEECQEFQR